MNVYQSVLKFQRKYPLTLAFRLKQHSKVIQDHLNPDETVKYAFSGQKNNRSIDTLNSYVIVLTDKRLLLGRKRLLFGYFFYSITPDLFNDLKIKSGIIWGQVLIDTLNELVIISNVSKNGLYEIETEVSQHMMNEKQKYSGRKDNCRN